MDTSDWKGLLNSNTNIPELRGFWLESSLKISPVEQTRVLAEIFKKNSPAAADLQRVMKIQDSPVKIYGKTGMGVKNDKVVDAWFVGFYETADNKIFLPYAWMTMTTTLLPVTGPEPAKLPDKSPSK